MDDKVLNEKKELDVFGIGFGLDDSAEYRPSKLERFRRTVESICGPMLLILGTIGVALVMAQAFLLVLGKI